MTIDFSPPARPEGYDLTGLVEKEYNITMRIRAWHDPKDVEPVGPEEIKEFFRFFIEKGYQDLWCVAVIEECKKAEPSVVNIGVVEGDFHA